MGVVAVGMVLTAFVLFIVVGHARTVRRARPHRIASVEVLRIHIEEAGETFAVEADAFEEAATATRIKLPEGWGEPRPNQKLIGYRWRDPASEGNGVRIDKGDPLNPEFIQQTDHAMVRSGGMVLGKDGLPLPSNTSIKQSPDLAHIPLDEWMKWQAGNTT